MTFKELASKLNNSVQTVPNLIQVLKDGFQNVEAGGSGGTNYSKTEQDTGLTYINNKKLYQITFEFTTESTSSYTPIDMTAINADYVAIKECTFDMISAYQSYYLTYSAVTFRFNTTSGKLEYYISDSTYVGKKVYITILYTKGT